MSRVTEWVPYGLATIDGQAWARCKARKASRCILSGYEIRPGDLVYRPIGNGANRMQRALASQVERPRITNAARSLLKGERPAQDNLGGPDGQ